MFEFFVAVGMQLIESLIYRVDLSEAEAEASLDFLLNDTNEALISAFLVLLRAKGETYEEVCVSLLWDSVGINFCWYFERIACPILIEYLIVYMMF